MNFDNTYKTLPPTFYSNTKPSEFSQPNLLAFNDELAKELGFDPDQYTSEELAKIFSGQILLEGSAPIALAYAGHQFGNFVPQLGDGRAIMLGEVLTKNSKRYDLQLKGSGRTVFSRGGDGFSALGPVIREYILSEAMYALGIPTTRALAAVETGDLVRRETVLPGGVFTRVASSHIRVGTFEYFAGKKDINAIKVLLSYAIERHYPHLKKDDALGFLKAVIEKQIELVSSWMSIGFIHGVMNTDNTSISGETIDFGPCAFMDKFSQAKVFSSIDQYGRYAYNNQGPILSWNMTRLAECLIDLVDVDESKAIDVLNETLSKIKPKFESTLNKKMTAKIGLNEEDNDLVAEFLEILEKEKKDFTLSFRNLGNGDFPEFEQKWVMRLIERGKKPDEILDQIKAVNPLYIPRNHQVEKAIQGALRQDLSTFQELNELLKNPFQFNPKLDRYKQEPTEDEIVCETFCGT
ncbi:MAG: YdiU family protein [Lentisphaeria bacterium]|nr:YdiU family protein [Lentisphaeria bacterium]